MKKLFSLALAALIVLAVEALAQVSKPSLILQPPTPAAGDGFGTAVVAFGNAILVGAPGDDSLATDAGAVYLFEGATGKLLRAFLNPSPAAGDSFGAAIAVAGTFVIIGAPGDDAGAPNAGVAYIFDGDTGTRFATLSNPNAVADDGLGSSVAVAGNLVIVGAPFVNSQASDVGAIDLFDLNTGQRLTRIVNPDNADAFAHFGISIAAIGNNFAVGTPSDGDATISSYGSVSLFNGTNGQLIRNIPNPRRTGPDPTQASDNGFGQSIAVLGSDLLVGAPFNSSSAAVYLINATTGQVIRTFANPPPAPDNRFGFSVAAAGSNFLVGAPFDPTKASRAGIAYLFNGANGQRLRTFLPQNLSADNFFGFAVAIAGNDTVVGAPDSSAIGAAYSFQPAITCQLTILSPQNGIQTCEDNIQIKASVEITGGVRPFNRVGNVNGVTATFAGDTLFATIPLTLGGNTIIVNCAVTDSVGAQTVCSNTTTITMFPKIYQIVINEILYDPNYDDFGTERIELKNMSDDTTHLDGFALWIRHEDLDTYWLFPDGVSIAPGGLLTVHWLKDGIEDRGNVFTGLPADGGSEENPNPDPDNFWGNNSTNSNDMTLGGAGDANDIPFAIALFQPIRREDIAEFREACRMVDFVQIGGSIPVIDALADQARLWSAGEFLAFPPQGHSYEFDDEDDDAPTRTSPGDFTDQSSPSIGFKNKLAPPPSQHLLISEVCVRPAFGEFVEIHNSTESIIELNDYYLTDNANFNDNAYALLVKGSDFLEVRPGDFFVRFPDGAEIGPGEYQTVAFRATDFRKRYGSSVNPTYEIFASDPAVPDMNSLRPISGIIGFDDADELVILLRWDGASDLVEDVDYVVWGRFTPIIENEKQLAATLAADPLDIAVTKTGLGIDGVDSDSVRSYYDNETPDLQQRPVAGQAHALLKSWQRRPTPREFGELPAGGNGISGHDETSENLARAFRQAKPTPNRRTKGLDLVIVEKIVKDTLRTANGNGILNPGEEVRLRLRLRNNSPDSTGTLFSILRSPSPLIIIGPDSTSAFTNIDPGKSVLSSEFYEFSVKQTLLPDSIEFVLLVIDKEAGSADTTQLPFALPAASPLPDLKIASQAFAFDGANLLVFFKLENKGNTDAVSICTRLDFPGLDLSSTSRQISNVDWEHCVEGNPCVTGTICAIDAPCVPLKEEKISIAIPAGLLNTVTTLSGALIIESGTFNARLDGMNGINLTLPFISVNVRYPRSQGLVPGVTINLIERTSTASTPVDVLIKTVVTDIYGLAKIDFDENLFVNRLAPNVSYLLRMATPATVAPSDLLKINFGDLFFESKSCPQRVAAPLPEDILLGDVNQDGAFLSDDCTAIQAYAIVNPTSIAAIPPTAALTGQWRVKNTDPRNALRPNEANLGPGVSINPTSRFLINFNAMLLGDLNASWQPPPSAFPIFHTAKDAPVVCVITSSSSSSGHGLTSEVKTDIVSALPETPELLQNYPNPLLINEPSQLGTTIRFILPKPGLVSVKIYNILGKLVKNLVAQQLPTGVHDVVWRGDSDNGDVAVSGIYFVRLQVGNTVKVQRVVLVR